MTTPAGEGDTAGRGGGAPRTGGVPHEHGLTVPVRASDTAEALEAHRAQRRGLYNSFGTAWSSAFEAAVAPMIIAAGGWILDRWLGIFPALTIVFFVVGASGAGVRLYYAYRTRMEIEEANRPWAPQHPDWAEDDK